MPTYAHSTDPYHTDPYGNPIRFDASTAQPTIQITPRDGGRQVTYPPRFPLLQVSTPTASRPSSLPDATSDLPKKLSIGQHRDGSIECYRADAYRSQVLIPGTYGN